MYKIVKKKYGFKLTFCGIITQIDMAKWGAQLKSKLYGRSKEFGVLVDMRTIKPLSNDAQLELHAGQKYFRTKGMQRSAVILAGERTVDKFKSFAKNTGVYKWERYICANITPDWEIVGLDWIENGIDPDKY